MVSLTPGLGASAGPSGALTGPFPFLRLFSSHVIAKASEFEHLSSSPSEQVRFKVEMVDKLGDGVCWGLSEEEMATPLASDTWTRPRFRHENLSATASQDHWQA